MYKKRKIFKKQNRAVFNRLKREYSVYFDTSIHSELIDRGKSQNDKARLISFLLKKHSTRVKNIIVTDKLFLEIIGLGKLISTILNRKGVRPRITAAFRPINDKIKRKELVLRSEVEQLHIALKEIFDKEIRILLPQELIFDKAEKSLKQFPYKKQFCSLSFKVIEFAKNIANSHERFNRFINNILEPILINQLFQLIANPKRVFPNSNEIINFLILKYTQNGLLSTNLLLVMSWLKEHVEVEWSLPNKGLIEAQKDIADAEVMPLAIYGYKKRRVLVLTAEPRKDIDIRKKAYLQGVEEIIRNNLKYKDRLTQHPENLRIGKLIVVDFKKLNSSGIALKKIKIPYIR